ncbi:hypothetical protein PSAC2689_100184 [Paraburkholderia sacchari]
MHCSWLDPHFAEPVAQVFHLISLRLFARVRAVMVAALAVQREGDARPRAFVDFAAQGDDERFNVRKHDATRGRFCVDRGEGAGVFRLHAQ